MYNRDDADKSIAELEAMRNELRDLLTKEEKDSEEVIRDFKNLQNCSQKLFPKRSDARVNNYLRANEVNDQVDHLVLSRIISLTQDLTGITFKVISKSLEDKSIKYTLEITEPIACELMLELDKTAKYIVNIERLTFANMHDSLELKPSIKKFINSNSMPQLSNQLATYSELSVVRTDILMDLQELFKSYFFYSRSEELGCYEMFVKMDDLTVFHTNWKIVWYRTECSMGHNFVANIFQGTLEMGKRQEDNFLKLTKPSSLLLHDEIMKLLKSIILAFITDCDEDEDGVEEEQEELPES